MKVEKGEDMTAPGIKKPTTNRRDGNKFTSAFLMNHGEHIALLAEEHQKPFVPNPFHFFLAVVAVHFLLSFLYSITGMSCS